MFIWNKGKNTAAQFVDYELVDDYKFEFDYPFGLFDDAMIQSENALSISIRYNTTKYFTTNVTFYDSRCKKCSEGITELVRFLKKLKFYF